LPTTRWTEIKEIFANVLEAPLEERTALLVRECGEDGFVRNAVEELLRAHDRADTGFLTDGDTAAAAPPGDLDHPRELGPYEIGEPLGHGGFGIVYRATQHEPIEREVAVKLLKRGMDTDQILARFAQERRTLARLDHPHIARILDAGAAPDGRPFFAMELVRGTPVTAYCAARKLPLDRLVRLFVDICRAVHYAHQRGVIHRDLKPSNVLVTEVEGQATPKIIDFGIAKALADEEDTGHTQAGAVIGTPRYMSPEQRAGAISTDTRCDVYTLGVLLCEALTGDVPHVVDPSSAASADTPRSRSRAVRPSQIAAARNGAAAEHVGDLRGDLDRIILKAVAPDPDLRYASAAALAEDLMRYLEGRPIEARSPSWLYVTRKFIARRRALSAAVLLTVVSLIVGGAALVRGWREARNSLAAIEAANLLAGARDVDELRRVVAALEDRGQTGGRLHIEALHYLGAVLAGEDDPEAIDVLDQACGLARTRFGVADMRTLELEHELGKTLMDQEVLERAEAVLRDVTERTEAVHGRANHLYRNSIRRLALVSFRRERWEEALARSQVLLDITPELDLEGSAEHAVALHFVGVAHSRVGDFAAARNTLERGLELREANLGKTHHTVLIDRTWLGEALLALDEPAEARAVFAPVLLHMPPGNGFRIRAALGTADALVQLGDPATARSIVEQERSQFPETTPPPPELEAWLDEQEERESGPSMRPTG
jgi:serine/threonine protein kinase